MDWGYNSFAPSSLTDNNRDPSSRGLYVYSSEPQWVDKPTNSSVWCVLTDNNRDPSSRGLYVYSSEPQWVDTLNQQIVLYDVF